MRNFINIMLEASNSPEIRISAHDLYARYGQPLCRFSDLPPLAQKSVAVYMEGHCDIGPEHYTAPESLYSYAIIPMQVLKDAIMDCGGDIGDDHEDFDSYHAWYHKGPDVRNHREVWPIILGDEIIEDGWHRFHEYVEKGLEEVPAVWMA